MQRRSKRHQRGWIQYAAMAGAAILGGLLAKRGQDNANETNVELSAENRQFQADMSNTAWQRGVADMQKAGINPMLAISQGPASQPSGNMAQVQSSMAPAVSTAMQGMQLASEYQSIQTSTSQAQLMDAQRAKAQSETIDQTINNARALAELQLTRTEGKKREEETVSARHTASRLGQELEAMETHGPGKRDTGFEADVRKRKADARLRELDINEAEAQSKFWGSDIGSANPFLKQLMQIMQGISSARRIGN